MARSAARVRSPLVVRALGLATLAVLFTLALVFAPLASAQEPDKKPDKAEPKAEAKSDTAASASSSTTSASSAGTPNVFMHLVSSAGWVFGPLLLLVSIGLVALIVLLVLDLRLGNAIPPGFVEDFTDTVNKRQFKQAYEMAREDDSFPGPRDDGRHGGPPPIRRLEDRPKAAAQHGRQHQGRQGWPDCLPEPPLAPWDPCSVCSAPSWGMIRTFMALARARQRIQDRGGDPTGISHALVITLIGIGLSVPAIFFRRLQEPPAPHQPGHHEHRRRPADADVLQLPKGHPTAAAGRNWAQPGATPVNACCPRRAFPRGVDRRRRCCRGGPTVAVRSSPE